MVLPCIYNLYGPKAYMDRTKTILSDDQIKVRKWPRSPGGSEEVRKYRSKIERNMLEITSTSDNRYK